ASEKLNWLIGVFLIGLISITIILTGSMDLFRPYLAVLYTPQCQPRPWYSCGTFCLKRSAASRWNSVERAMPCPIASISNMTYRLLYSEALKAFLVMARDASGSLARLAAMACEIGRAHV